MAWTCTGKTNLELIDNLKRAGIIKSENVYNAMKAVDRADFVAHAPYDDNPEYIGMGATISAPHMHAHALEQLLPHLKQGSKVLDVGSGSGYLLACFARITAPNNRVIGVEHIQALVDKSTSNLQKNHTSFLKTNQISVYKEDGRFGYYSGAPYDAIHVGAAVSEEAVLIRLLRQLNVGGAIIGPFHFNVGKNLKVLPDDLQENINTSRDTDPVQIFVKFTRLPDNEINREVIFGVNYIPLTDEESQTKTV